jgi:hypothetical protein
MPGGGRHRFEFVGKEPPAFLVVATLLFVNTFLLLLLEFAGKYFLPKNVPAPLQWYQDNSIAIQFVLLALLAIILIVFRKRVRYSVRK